MKKRRPPRQRLRQEVQILGEVCARASVDRELGSDIKSMLLETFGERYSSAMELLRRDRVSRFMFKPSGRTVWTVQGRTGTYQIIPESNFCNCDDYYFRVLDREKSLCYHIIAQRLAESLGRFQTREHQDSDYSKITERWKSVLRELEEES